MFPGFLLQADRSETERRVVTADEQMIASVGPSGRWSAARYSVAPMMDWTDTHCRTFHRILTRRALLYTEMVTTGRDHPRPARPAAGA